MFDGKIGTMSQRASASLPVLIVDDEIDFVRSTGYAIESAGVADVVECTDPREALRKVNDSGVGAVLLDITMPYINGIDLLKQLSQRYPGLPVVIVTAANEAESAIASIRAGAFDYLVKPVHKDRLITTVRNALAMGEMKYENNSLKASLFSEALIRPEAFSMIITQSSNMQAIFKYIEAIGATTLPVLITGETGTGKELIAQAVHRVSGRRGQFVTVNVAGIDETLFSDTLFGHERGSFTGAEKHRDGLIDKASGGTLFLDEIGELSSESQVRLLRLLQERQYYPVGSDIAKMTDARIVAATNKNPLELVESGTFRRDLYYRLQYHQINVPPLRSRRGDIELLVRHFISEAARNMGKREPSIGNHLISLLQAYHFPGNIRELQAMIFDAIGRHEAGLLSTEAFQEKIGRQLAGEKREEGGLQPSETMNNCRGTISFPDKLPSMRKTVELLIAEAMQRAQGNQTVAAQLLGITRRALNNRLHRQIKSPD
jgi:DNA-binding NtrC family response regulator